MRRFGAAAAALQLLLLVACTPGNGHHPHRSGSATITPSTPPSHVAPVPYRTAAPPNVRVTQDRFGHYLRSDGSTDSTTRACGSARRQQDEPSVAVDPRNPRIVVVGVNDDCPDVVNATPWMGYYRSTDGGHTWHPSLLPGYPQDLSTAGTASPAHGRCQGASDPSLAFDRGGRLFYGFVCFPIQRGSGQAETISTLVAVYGHDGAHYLRTVLLAQGTRTFEQDKIDVAVDQTTGRHSGTVYAAWDELAPPTPGGFPRDLLRVARSIDHGVSFSAPKPVSSLHHAELPDLAIGPNGAVYLAFQVQETLWITTSTDGGRDFGTPSLVDDVIGFDSGQFAVEIRRDCGDGPFACRTGFSFPRFGTYQAVAADSRGVHIVWSARTPTNQGKVFIKSSPDGHTWNQPAQQIDHVPRGHQWFPDIVSSGGALTVVFYDSRADPAYSTSIPPGNTKNGTNSGPVVNVVAARSTDGGRTWTERRMTNRAFNPNLEAFDRVSFMGDYISVAQAGPSAVVAWTDLRDVVRGRDRRERGAHDGFDVSLPCTWVPPTITAKRYTRPFANDPCLGSGGLDENVYLARVPA